MVSAGRRQETDAAWVSWVQMYIAENFFKDASGHSAVHIRAALRDRVRTVCGVSARRVGRKGRWTDTNGTTATDTLDVETKGESW